MPCSMLAYSETGSVAWLSKMFAGPLLITSVFTLRNFSAASVLTFKAALALPADPGAAKLHHQAASPR